MEILIGSHMTCSAQALDLISAKCNGSWPGCMIIQVLLNHTLTTDIAQQSWATLVVALVDCCTCYDSVSHPLASIACQHLGVSPSVLKTIFPVSILCIFSSIWLMTTLCLCITVSLPRVSHAFAKGMEWALHSGSPTVSHWSNHFTGIATWQPSLAQLAISKSHLLGFYMLITVICWASILPPLLLNKS